jgi:hypothetical protein
MKVFKLDLHIIKFSKSLPQLASIGVPKLFLLPQFNEILKMEINLISEVTVS